MKLSLEWLSEFVTWTEKDPLRIAERLTLCVAEVEDVEVQGALLEHCCVGEILSLEKHPNADTLHLVNVQTDKGVQRVVCGGTNMQKGMLVAFAHIGATVRWHGGETMKLQKVKIRGEESTGMICAAEELGLESLYTALPADGPRPIMDIAHIVPGGGRVATGMSLKNALGLSDVIFHVSNTAITHRPDLFSHVGFARECVAVGLAKWKKKPILRLPKFTKDPLPFKIENTTKGLVPRYCCCTVDLGAVPATPLWMQRRLLSTGWRPRGLVIDITNYVMMETGMPLHSFNIVDIDGDITIREAKHKERIRTLDGAEHTLPEGALVMSDKQGIFDLMGIMGGKRSCTTEMTKQIFLHSAVIDAIAIRHTVLATGHRTDASTVYEKSIPLSAAPVGLSRALELIFKLIPGSRITSNLHQWGKDSSAKPIPLSPDHVASILGMEVPKKTVIRMLQSIDCSVQQKAKGLLAVTPPPHRENDLRLPEDLIEEIARLIGYENVPEKMPLAPVRIPEREGRQTRLRDELYGLGYCEIVPLSFVGPDTLQEFGFDVKNVRGLQNPLSEEYAFLQPSTLPSLLANAEANILEAEQALQTFTMATVFSSKEEHTELGLLRCSFHETSINDDPFLLLKRDCGVLLSTLGYGVHIVRASAIPAFAHGGKTADLFAVSGDTTQRIGMLCEIHPTVRTRHGLTHRAAAALLNLQALLGLQKDLKTFQQLPRFPAIQYDLTVRRTLREPLGPTLLAVRNSHPLINDVAVVDYFSNASMGKQEYNVTLRCTYRSPERTLTEDEAKVAHAQVEARFAKRMSERAY